MPKLLRNIVAVIGGILIGGWVNMGLIKLGPSLIPPPAGVDGSSPENLAKTIHLFEPRHFITPFLAHALGTFVGALIVYMIAANHRRKLPWIIGGFYLFGGIAASLMIPAPAWFIALDLVAAYLPMAFLGIQIGRLLKPETNETPQVEQSSSPSAES